MMKTTRHSVTIEECEKAERLDRALARTLPNLSRTRIKNLISSGHVSLEEGTITDPSARVKPGKTYIVTEPEAVSALPVPQNIPLNIVYEDADVIVVDKPAGLVVHPAAGNPDHTLVNALLAHCADSLSGIGGVRRPGIVHRIDKDTSGLMIIAKNDAAHAALAKQFENHSIERAYKAVVWGALNPKKGTVTGNIGRSPRNRKKMALVRRGGKTAVTHYRTLEVMGEPGAPVASLVECRLETGRTHQIRVHLASLGTPLIGDPLYGGRQRHVKRHLDEDASRKVSAFDRQALHAGILGFNHPVKGVIMRFESPLPADLLELLEALKNL